MTDPRVLKVTQGFNGWTPKLSVVSDGARRVLKLSGWTGGQGNPPQYNLFLGLTGYVTDIADAVNIAGDATLVQYQEDGVNVGAPDVDTINFTGDVDVSYLSGTLTINSKLADVITAGTYGSSTQVPIITFNAKGIATTVNLADIGAPVLTEATFVVQKNGSPSISATWSLTAFTESHVHTYPNKDINFGNMSFIATTDSNTLSGTRCRIVGGSNNNVSGTDNVAIGCTSVTLSGTGNSAYDSTGVTLAGNTPGTAQSATGVLMASGVTLSEVNWIGAKITGSNRQAGALGSGVLSGWPADLSTAYIPFGVLVETSGIRGIRAPEIGPQYVWADGYSYTGTRADVGGSNPKAVLSAGKSAVHEVTFIYTINNYNMYTAVRRVAVGGGLGTIATARVSSVQTVGTDIALEEYAAFEDPTFTITVDLTNNLVIPTVEKNNGGQPVIVQTRTRSYYT